MMKIAARERKWVQGNMQKKSDKKKKPVTDATKGQ